MIFDEMRLLEEMSPADRKAKEGLLHQPYFRRLLGSMVREVDGKKQQLAAQDLSTDEGVKKAMKLQGEISGMVRFLDVLTEKDDVASE